MKVKLYHKWIQKIIKHINNGDGEWAWCNKLLRNDKLTSNKRVDLSYSLGICHNHDNWCSVMYSYIKKEVDDFKFKYRKYSSKYWTPEARMMRMLKGEDD